MEKIKKFLKNLDDKTTKLNKKDYIIIGILVFLYAIISFYRLGSTKVPNTYYSFKEIGDEISINFDQVGIGKIMYYTGYNIGELEVYALNDNDHYYKVGDIKTNSVLSWEESNIAANTTSLKFVSKTYEMTLGDIALYDSFGNRINIPIDKTNPLLDETNMVPDQKSFMNSMYFDEIYYGRCSYEYTHGLNCFEWSHPPLGKVLMSIPVFIFGFSPFATRLMGNIAGILLIPVMYVLCKKFFKNRKYALLGAILMMFDCMHFAHTRIALVDGYQLLFILLSVLFMKNYLDLKKDDSFKKKSINLILSGVFIGCAISTKWNAAYVALGLAIVFFAHLLKQYNVNIIKYCKNRKNLKTILKCIVILLLIPILINYTSLIIFGKDIATKLLIGYLVIIVLNYIIWFSMFMYKDKYLLKLFGICILSFIVIPLVIYILSYLVLPNVSYYDRTLSGIIDQTKLMYDYHSNLDATHPFSSVWYEWPIMHRPVWFYSMNIKDGIRSTITDIGNPAIWWTGIVAFVYLIISSIKKKPENRFILVFILTTFIPYIFIGRVMFMYHFFITLPFIMMAIVAFIKWLTEKFKTNGIYWIYIAFVIVLFFVFYPVISGMNVSEDYIDSLRWLSNWWF